MFDGVLKMFGMLGGASKAANNFSREGTVSAVYPERHSARVTFEDRDNLVSAELPVLTPFASKNKSFAMPDVGERVVVLMAANDQTSGGGWIIGSLYTAKNLPSPETGENITRLEFADKTFISYDRESHLFTLQFSDGTAITHDGESGELNIDCKGDIIINGEKQLDVTIKDRISVDGREEINIDAKDDINMNGANIRLN